jgi:hypothetical protein
VTYAAGTDVTAKYTVVEAIAGGALPKGSAVHYMLVTDTFKILVLGNLFCNFKTTKPVLVGSVEPTGTQFLA